MYSALTHSHSGIRYLVIIGFISLLIHSFMNYSKDDYSNKLHKHAKVVAYLFYLNVLIGVALHFISIKVLIGPEAMKDSFLRFFTLEHPFMILISLSALKIGSFRASRINSGRSNRILAYATLISLLILLAGIPWPFREGLVMGWF